MIIIQKTTCISIAWYKMINDRYIVSWFLCIVMLILAYVFIYFFSLRYKYMFKTRIALYCKHAILDPENN